MKNKSKKESNHKYYLLKLKTYNGVLSIAEFIFQGCL